MQHSKFYITSGISIFAIHRILQFMPGFICVVALAPVYKEAAFQSEMTSQLLFGEACTLLEEGGNGWSHICFQFDGYTGWCRTNQLLKVDDTWLKDRKPLYAADWVSEAVVDGLHLRLPLGSNLAGLGTDAASPVSFQFEGRLRAPERRPELIESVAFLFLNTPYLWGGRSVMGIDCSGFVQSVYKFLDCPIPRDASQQALAGEPVDSLSLVRPGDLAFFQDKDGNVIHVGLLIQSSQIIHAFGRVREDVLTEIGIINPDTGKLTHRLFGIRRFL